MEIKKSNFKMLLEMFSAARKKSRKAEAKTNVTRKYRLVKERKRNVKMRLEKRRRALKRRLDAKFAEGSPS